MNILRLFAFLSFCQLSFAQNYWQQEVNYTIDVKLNDATHSLSAIESFEYINHSPNELTQLWIHLWPNAYRGKNSALAKQQYDQGEDLLYFGDSDEKGFIDSLDFKVDGVPISWEFDSKNKDICVLTLSKPLKTGQKVVVSTPFYVKIPSGEISRLGHVGQSYQITQWYPKPAVYDHKGWHAMPYLNQGEFYSEYGSFDVRITLPSNYVVGATGDLQTNEEIQFMDSLSNVPFDEKTLSDKASRKGLNAFPPTSTSWKTIQFKQNNVHDFGWFADKRFKVLKGKVKLPHSGREVTSWALYTPANAAVWKNAIEYINDGTYYYSLWNGDYPYNQVTAVDGTISAGGGMEYPNVTVIGTSRSPMELEIVIVHEVGHNWFYGIIGSNERQHGWMDEGMNTLNEMRYVATKYPDNQQMSDMVLGGRFHFNDLDHHDMGDISYRAIAGLGEDQPIETPSEDFTPANYGVVMYQKTGLVFFYLKDYLGEKLFDECMQAYFEAWKFKHPYPEDMEALLERVSGKDLDWLFKDLIQTRAHVDYKLSKVKQRDGKTEVTVINKGQVNGPVEVSLFSDESKLATKWAEPVGLDNPFKRRYTLTFDGVEANGVKIDTEKDIPEMYRYNNDWHKKGLFHKLEPVKMEFLFGDKEQGKTNLFWTPVIAGNYFDKLMLGAAIHNMGIPFSKWQYVIAPMYSFGRKMISGMGELSYTHLPKRSCELVRLGVSIKSFKEDSSSIIPSQSGAYLAYSPYLLIKLNAKKPSTFDHSLLAQGIIHYNIYGGLRNSYSGAFLRYQARISTADHQLSFNLRPEYIENEQVRVVRAMFTGTYRFRYLRQSMNRWIELRVFAGKMNYQDKMFPSISTYPYALSLSGADGNQDLFLEDYYFGRGLTSGIWSQQRAENMGGFKSTSYFGSTTNWLTSGNLLFQLPIPRFSLLYGFVDAGFFENGNGVQKAVNAGLGLRISSVFGLYFPLWMSDDLNASFGNAGYAEKIRFTLRLNPVNSGVKLTGLF